jgi:hypothetical protein
MLARIQLYLWYAVARRALLCTLPKAAAAAGVRQPAPTVSAIRRVRRLPARNPSLADVSLSDSDDSGPVRLPAPHLSPAGKRPCVPHTLIPHVWFSTLTMAVSLTVIPVAAHESVPADLTRLIGTEAPAAASACGLAWSALKDEVADRLTVTAPDWALVRAHRGSGGLPWITQRAVLGLARADAERAMPMTSLFVSRCTDRLAHPDVRTFVASAANVLRRATDMARLVGTKTSPPRPPSVGVAALYSGPAVGDAHLPGVCPDADSQRGIAPIAPPDGGLHNLKSLPAASSARPPGGGPLADLLDVSPSTPLARGRSLFDQLAASPLPGGSGLRATTRVGSLSSHDSHTREAD